MVTCSSYCLGAGRMKRAMNALRPSQGCYPLEAETLTKLSVPFLGGRGRGGFSPSAQGVRREPSCTQLCLIELLRGNLVVPKEQVRGWGRGSPWESSLRCSMERIRGQRLKKDRHKLCPETKETVMLKWSAYYAFPFCSFISCLVNV